LNVASANPTPTGFIQASLSHHPAWGMGAFLVADRHAEADLADSCSVSFTQREVTEVMRPLGKCQFPSSVSASEPDVLDLSAA
jgi:hypothetical protein